MITRLWSEVSKWWSTVSPIFTSQLDWAVCLDVLIGCGFRRKSRLHLRKLLCHQIWSRFHPSTVRKPKLSFCDSVQRLVSKLLLLHPVKHRAALGASSWSSHWWWKWSSRLFCSSHHTNIMCTSAALLPVSISISFYFPGFLLSSAS